MKTYQLKQGERLGWQGKLYSSSDPKPPLVSRLAKSCRFETTPQASSCTRTCRLPRFLNRYRRGLETCPQANLLQSRFARSGWLTKISLRSKWYANKNLKASSFARGGSFTKPVNFSLRSKWKVGQNSSASHFARGCRFTMTLKLLDSVKMKTSPNLFTSRFARSGSRTKSFSL